MTRFLKIFLRDSLPRAVQLAGFGKHPAWDDHIDDLGLTTETLAIVRQMLYSEGIASQLSSGVWARLEENGQALVFDHRFVWSRETQSVVGGIWASNDGKGRTHFPMIICLQIGLNGWRAIHSFFAPVEGLAAVCKTARDQQTFRDAFAAAQLRLSSQTFSDSAPGGSLVNLTEQQEQAILNGMIALSQGIKKYRKEGARDGDKSMHFRLPPISTQTQESLEFWSRYLETRLDVRFPCLAIASTGLGPVDIIAGKPEPDDFFCLRAAVTGLPMTQPAATDKHLPDVQMQAKTYLRLFELGSTEWTPSRQRRWWPFK